jgi:hypothetical protein
VKLHLTQEISHVEAFRTLPPFLLKVAVTPSVRERTGIHELAHRKEDQLIEEGNDIGPRLMDGKYDGAFVVPGEVDKRFDDVEGVVRVQACEEE